MKPFNITASRLHVYESSSGITGNSANVVPADIQTASGMFHIIDKVLLPK